MIHEQILNNIKQYNTSNDSYQQIIRTTHEIAPVLTRSQRKLINTQANNYQNNKSDSITLNINKNIKKDPLMDKFEKAINDDGNFYLVRPLESNILYTTDLEPLQLVHKEQHKYFRNVFRKINDDKYVLPRTTLIDEHYIKILNKLKINIDKILIYNNTRIVLTPSLVTAFIQYIHVETLNHKGVQSVYDHMVKRYYFPNIMELIKIYIAQCICKAFEGIHKNQYYKDKGPLSPYTTSQPNERVFIDLFGPLHDGYFICVMYDLMDGYLVLKRVWPKAINIIKTILFHWCYKLGFIRYLTGDNASYFKSQLNKIYAIVTGVKLGHILSYSPWGNPAETQMKSVRKGIAINKWMHDQTGLGLVYDKLNRLEKGKNYSDYKPVIHAMAYAHNNSAHHHNFAPNESRFPTGVYFTPLELNLRLAHASTIKPQQYTNKKVVDYKKWIKLIKRQAKYMLNLSKKQRKEFEIKTKLKYNLQQNIPILKNDYVFFKPLNKSDNKFISTELYGWYVQSVQTPGKLYTIKNIFSEIRPDINHGHLTHAFAPIWRNPLDMMQSSLLKIQDLDKEIEEYAGISKKKEEKL